VTTKHSPECIERQRAFAEEEAQTRAAQEAYDAQWPHYCKSCGGGGWFYSAGGRYTQPESNPCACIEDGRCPRCGEKGIYYEDGIGDRALPSDDLDTERPCLYCGFDTSSGQGRPEPSGYYPECDCWNLSGY
jgi:hypothetical protein